MELLEELQEAISEKNTEKINKLKRILLYGEDSYTRNKQFIENIKGKTLCKILVRIIKKDDTLDNIDYMKMVSSLLTHNLIEAQITKSDIDTLPVKELYVLLGEFLSSTSDIEMEACKEKCRKFLLERYGDFLEDKLN